MWYIRTSAKQQTVTQDANFALTGRAPKRAVPQTPLFVAHSEGNLTYSSTFTIDMPQRSCLHHHSVPHLSKPHVIAAHLHVLVPFIQQVDALDAVGCGGVWRRLEGI